MPSFNPWRFLPRTGLPIATQCRVCEAVHAFPVGWSVLAKFASLAIAGGVPMSILGAHLNDSSLAFVLALIATVFLFPLGAWIATVACFGLGMRLDVGMGRKVRKVHGPSTHKVDS
jgi:hypothetical protein